MVHHHTTGNCTSVTPTCPVAFTTYGYYPVLWANALFCALFFLCLFAQIGLGVYYRTWTFLLAVGLGTFGEGVGYVGRLLMHRNPWSKSGFETQICCLVLAPSFLAAGVYLILRNLVIYEGPECSRLKPRLYTWLFIGCDIGSIVVQACGGGVAASAGNRAPFKQSLLNAGDGLIVTGIALQAVTMACCAVFALDFYVRLRKSKEGRNAGEKGQDDMKKSKGVRILTFAAIFSFVTIFIRCIYRIPEMAGGWGNPLMRREPEFLTLDGMMIAFASIALTLAHPGWTFPPMRKGSKQHA